MTQSTDVFKYHNRIESRNIMVHAYNNNVTLNKCINYNVQNSIFELGYLTVITRPIN